MTENNLDQQIREAVSSRASASVSGELDLERIGARADAIRRRRAATVAGGAVLGLAVVVGGFYATQGDPGGHNGQVAVDPSANSSPSTTPDSSPPASVSNSRYETLLGQLQDMPKVRDNLMAPVPGGHVVLCGMNVQGQDPAKREIYAFILCGAYTTGPDAELVSGGSDPVVITTDGRGGLEATVVDVEFPGMANRAARIREMFPPALVDTMTSPQSLPIEPTMAEMLETARNTHG